MLMRSLALLTALVTTLLCSGCHAPSGSQGYASTLNSAEGTYVACEEGFFILRGGDGRIVDFLLPDDWDLDSTVERFFSKRGKACRVHFKQGTYENPLGEVIRAPQLVHVEWL